jgi:hypothetical protein
MDIKEWERGYHEALMFKPRPTSEETPEFWMGWEDAESFLVEAKTLKREYYLAARQRRINDSTQSELPGLPEGWTIHTKEQA